MRDSASRDAETRSKQRRGDDHTNNLHVCSPLIVVIAGSGTALGCGACLGPSRWVYRYGPR